jgi:UDP-N-acetyl-D-mannosaminuronic acid dehydrogenase
VIVATNHSAFEGRAALSEIVDRASPNCLLVDPWDALGTGQVFIYGAETSALLRAAGSVSAPEGRPSG